MMNNKNKLCTRNGRVLVNNNIIVDIACTFMLKYICLNSDIRQK